MGSQYTQHTRVCDTHLHWDARFMRYATDIRGTRLGGETAGGIVSGRWSLVAGAETLGCPGPTVPLGWRYVWYFGTRGLWCLWIFGFLGP